MCLPHIAANEISVAQALVFARSRKTITQCIQDAIGSAPSSEAAGCCFSSKITIRNSTAVRLLDEKRELKISPLCPSVPMPRYALGIRLPPLSLRTQAPRMLLLCWVKVAQLQYHLEAASKHPLIIQLPMLASTSIPPLQWHQN